MPPRAEIMVVTNDLSVRTLAKAEIISFIKSQASPGSVHLTEGCGPLRMVSLDGVVLRVVPLYEFPYVHGSFSIWLQSAGTPR